MAISYQYTAGGYEAGEVEDYGLPPNNSTRDPMPPAKKGFIRRRVGDEWIYVEDHKGKSGYINGRPHTIKEYGPLPDGWSDTPPEPTFDEAVAAKCAEIHAGYDAALAASLTMPASKTPPSAVEIALALDDFKAEDPEGWAFIRATHTARRDELLAQVEAAGSAAEVQGITVSYAV